jgi:hypothetical protein
LKTESLTSQYTECEGQEFLGKTLEHLRENIKAGICLICIEDVERNEAVSWCLCKISALFSNKLLSRLVSVVIKVVDWDESIDLECL